MDSRNNIEDEKYIEEEHIESLLTELLVGSFHHKIVMNTNSTSSLAYSLHHPMNELYDFRILLEDIHKRERFLRLLCDMFADATSVESMLTGMEYFQLTTLVCQNFQRDIFQDILGILVVDSENEWDCLLDSSDFWNVFQLVFHSRAYFSWFRDAFHMWMTNLSKESLGVFCLQSYFSEKGEPMVGKAIFSATFEHRYIEHEAATTSTVPTTSHNNPQKLQDKKGEEEGGESNHNQCLKQTKLSRKRSSTSSSSVVYTTASGKRVLLSVSSSFANVVLKLSRIVNSSFDILPK
eukprot:m.28000 g.28000  ORF g.28000 m.28000 type:complete len:293 (+) comp9414_c0_seq3:48-926(+)